MPFCIFLQMNEQQFKPGVWNYLDSKRVSLRQGPCAVVSMRFPTLTTHIRARTLAVQKSVATAFARMHGTEECSAQACL